MLRQLLHIIVILSLPPVFSDGGGSAFAQTKSQKPSTTSLQEQAPLRINTALVTLSVGVNDKNGRTVANLTKESFEIFEDGRLQSIEFFGQEDQPISFGLLLDRSRSMNESAKLENAKAVAISFLRAGNPQNEAFCLAFNESPSLVADFTSDYAKIESSLAGVQAEGGTALYDAIIEGLEKLERAKHRRRAMVVIMDGRDQHSESSLADLVKRAQQSDAQIYTVGFFSPVESEYYKDEGRTVRLAHGIEVDNPRFVFKTLADETGAETFFPKSAKEFSETIARVAASLRRQYTLAYYPTNQSYDDAYRRIMVKVRGDHGEVKTRKGYRLSEPLGSAADETAEAQPSAKQPSTVIITLPKRIQPVSEQLAPPILQDKFDNPSDSLVKWPQSGKCQVSKGKLYVAEECVVPVGAFIYDDFEAMVTATFLTRAPRSAKVADGSASGVVNLPTIGLSFRINEHGYYTLMLAPPTIGGIGSGGLYKLLKVDSGRQTDIARWNREKAISMRNQIRLRCAGSKTEIYVNGLRLATLEDDTHKRGLISLVFSGESGMFDDLTVKKLDSTSNARSGR